MKIVLRFIVLLIIVPSAYYFLFWIPFSFIPVGELHWLRNLISIICALGVGFYIWVKLGTAPEKLMTCILSGAVLGGAIGFSAGFFGPIILTPGANQGPLLGIFFTGPIGFCFGGIVGLLYWSFRNKNPVTN